MKIEIIYNVITTEKVDASVNFYTRHFGFEVVADVGFYKHLRNGEGLELAFMEPNHPSQPPLYQPSWDGSGLIITFQVPDVDAAYDTLTSKGVPIAFELTTETWGQRHFGIRDPNGIPIDIVQHVETEEGS